MKSVNMNNNGIDTGYLGEEIAAQYLKNKGFSVITRNYRKKWGEIDLVTSKEGKIHFIEVKSVSCEIGQGLEEDISRITEKHLPEERVHEQKSKRIFRAIQSYLEEYEEEGEWALDIVAVFIDPKTKKALVRSLEDVTLS